MSDYIKREDALFVAYQQPFYSVVSQIKQLEGINIDDYVPKDFHDKTCEAMAKRHQEEIANMVSVVRCKECRYWIGETEYYYCALEDRPNRQWSVDETDYCSWGEREVE